MATIDDMEVHICGKCGVESWMLRLFINDKRQSKESFYCPNGHPRTFARTTEDILRDQLKTVKNDLEIQTTKIAKIKAGKCPFCWKSVKDLSHHLERWHN